MGAENGQCVRPGDDRGDPFDRIRFQVGIDRQAQDAGGRCGCGWQVGGGRARQAAIHGESGDEGMEVAPRDDPAFPESMPKHVTGHGIGRVHKDGEVGVIHPGFVRRVEAPDAGNPGQQPAIGGGDAGTPGDRPIGVLQLEQSQRGVEFAHLAVDAGVSHG